MLALRDKFGIVDLGVLVLTVPIAGLVSTYLSRDTGGSSDKKPNLILLFLAYSFAAACIGFGCFVGVGISWE